LSRVIHQFKDLTEGIFIERINRFLALVKVKEEIILVHVPSSGRMKELLYALLTILRRDKDYR
jgi:sugar fermentation stimulation protein A